jgi:hypothetical protein
METKLERPQGTGSNQEDEMGSKITSALSNTNGCHFCSCLVMNMGGWQLGVYRSTRVQKRWSKATMGWAKAVERLELVCSIGVTRVRLPQLIKSVNIRL